MKIFQRYNPLQVAKYVKILFRGRLYIKDVGAFEVDVLRGESPLNGRQEKRRKLRRLLYRGFAVVLIRFSLQHPATLALRPWPCYQSA